MSLTRDERRRMLERQRTITLPPVAMRPREPRAIVMPRVSTRALVGLTLAALAAAALTIGPHFAANLPQSLLDALMPAVF